MDAETDKTFACKRCPGLALVLALAAVGYLLWSEGKPGAEAGSRRPVAGAPVPPLPPQPSRRRNSRWPASSSLMKLEGKPVLIEFGMVGCALSEQGLDSMIALQKAGAVPGLAFVRVEGNPDAAVVAQYFKDKAPPFPVYRDSQSALAKALSATAYPTFLLADKFGHIRYQGNYPQENLVQWGKALAAENQDPAATCRSSARGRLTSRKLLADKLPDLKGQVKPLSEYKGSGGLVLLFVDTSCPFSAAALQDMPMVSKSLAGQNVNAVVLNNGDDPVQSAGLLRPERPRRAGRLRRWGGHARAIGTCIRSRSSFTSAQPGRSAIRARRSGPTWDRPSRPRWGWRAAPSSSRRPARALAEGSNDVAPPVRRREKPLP